MKWLLNTRVFLTLIQRRLTYRQTVTTKISVDYILRHTTLSLIFRTIVGHQSITLQTACIFTIPDDFRIVSQIVRSKQSIIGIAYWIDTRVHHYLCTINGSLQQVLNITIRHLLWSRTYSSTVILQPCGMIQHFAWHIRTNHIFVDLALCVIRTYIIQCILKILLYLLRYIQIRITVFIKSRVCRVCHLIVVRNTAIILCQRTIGHCTEIACNTFPVSLGFVRNIHSGNLLKHDIGFINNTIIARPSSCLAIPVRSGRSGEINISWTVCICIIQIDKIIRIVISREITGKNSIVGTISCKVGRIEVLRISTQRSFSLPIRVIGLLVLRVFIQKIVATAERAHCQRTNDV